MQKYTSPYPTIGNVIDAIQHRGRRNIICLNSD